MREKRPLNPAEAYRRSQKKKAKKEKAQGRKERSTRIPIDRKDPHQLIAQIQKYEILEYEGKLAGDGRAHKKRLTDQFNALRKARISAGLDPINLPKFDPDVYEANKAKAKMGGGYNVVLERMLDDVRRTRRAEAAIDPETGLPRLPEGEPPFPDGIPGLPPYNIVAEESQEAEEETDLPEKSDEGPKIMYAAPATLRRVKKDKIDQQVDDFLSQL